MQRAALLAAVASVAVLLVAPSVLADHAYTHRYYVVGRVIDAAAEPVSGALVTALFPGQAAGPCTGANAPAPDLNVGQVRTGAEGDFVACFHVHNMPKGQALIVNVSGDVLELTADDDVRRTVVHHRFEDTSDRKDSGGVQYFPLRYAVAGRLWQETGPVTVESIPANGTTPRGEPVNVTLRLDDGRSFTEAAKTDTYGDYRATFTADRPLGPGFVVVEALDRVLKAPLDLAFHRSDINVETRLDDGERLSRELGSGPPSGEVRPGTEKPAPGVGVVALAAAVAVGAFVARRRTR